MQRVRPTGGRRPCEPIGRSRNRPTLEEIRRSLPPPAEVPAAEARRRRAARPAAGRLARTVCRLQPGQAGRGLEPREDPPVPRAGRRLPDHRLPAGARPVPRGAGAQLVLARDHPGQHRVHGARRRHRLHDPRHAHPRGARLRVRAGRRRRGVAASTSPSPRSTRPSGRRIATCPRAPSARDRQLPQPVPGVDRRADPGRHVGLRVPRAIPTSAAAARVRGRVAVAHAERDLRRDVGRGADRGVLRRRAIARSARASRSTTSRLGRGSRKRCAT